MHRTVSIIIAAGMLASCGTGAAQQQPARAPSSRGTEKAPVMEVFKSPTCGCCAKWVEYMRANGFTVRVNDVADLTKVKATHQIPGQLLSCHTGLVNGYAIEGHVPAADVHRLLKERPAVTGIAVPDMPTGSPGMEVEGVKAQPYDVMSFDKQGTTRVFARH